MCWFPNLTNLKPIRSRRKHQESSHLAIWTSNIGPGGGPILRFPCNPAPGPLDFSSSYRHCSKWRIDAFDLIRLSEASRNLLGTGIDIGWYWDIHNQHLAASSVGQQVSRTPEMKAQDSRCYKTSLLDHLAESFPVGSTNCHRGMVGWASRHTALQLLRCLPRVIGSWIWWSVTKGLDQTTSSEEIWSHNLPGFFWKWIGWKVSKR